MLAHRLRRWPNLETALGECPVFDGIAPHRVARLRCFTGLDTFLDRTASVASVALTAAVAATASFAVVAFPAAAGTLPD